VGLPNVGKSTIFNALTAAAAEVASYPFCTIEPNVGVVPVPDERLHTLARLTQPRKVTPTTLEFVDIAGLVKGASKGEGLGNQFLSHVRAVDAIAHIVRCFADPNVAHVHGAVNPDDDARVVETELILSDLEVVQRRLDKLGRLLRLGEKEAKKNYEALEGLQSALQQETAARDYVRTTGATLPPDLQLVTAKPVFYVANIDEPGDENDYLAQLEELARRHALPVVVIAGKLEMELRQLEPGEREEFRKEMGLTDWGLERLVSTGYRLLNLITFFTIVSSDLRAWTIPHGTTAVRAAGKIHSDMERGFIRAEILAFEDFVRCGSEASAREQGVLRSEGKDYIVNDGEIIHFRFNV